VSTVIRRTSAYNKDCAGLSIPAHDYVLNMYDGSRLESTIYRVGGVCGTIVATVSYTYNSNGDVLTISKT
jgi:hypothetical protein